MGGEGLGDIGVGAVDVLVFLNQSVAVELPGVMNLPHLSAYYITNSEYFEEQRPYLKSIASQPMIKSLHLDINECTLGFLHLIGGDYLIRSLAGYFLCITYLYHN